jgi:hypothetical protein
MAQDRQWEHWNRPHTHQLPRLPMQLPQPKPPPTASAWHAPNDLVSRQTPVLSVADLSCLKSPRGLEASYPLIFFVGRSDWEAAGHPSGSRRR